MNGIIVIGNGKGVLKSKKRDFIDDSIVIRINNFKINGYEDYVGTRTDIYSCNERYLDFIDTSTEFREKFCEDYGRKTAKIDLSCFSKEEFEKLRVEYLRVYTYPTIESDKVEIWSLFHNDASQVQKYPFKDKIRVSDIEFDNIYSNGFRSILYALKHYPNHEVYVTGFDNFMSSGWYWDGNMNLATRFIRTGNYTSRHPLLIERDKMKKLIKERRIVEI